MTACSTEAISGAWSEIAYVTIWRCGDATGAEYAALTETIEIDQGRKDMEFFPTLYGGKVGKRVPPGEITITFDAYPLSIGGEITGQATGTSMLFQGPPGVWPTTDPKVIYSTPWRNVFRISVLWTDDPNLATLTGAGSTAIGANAYRYSVASATCTQHNISFTDGILKVSWEFKAPPYNKWRVANVREESSNGTTGLSALSEYNAVNYPQDGSAYTWE